MLLHHTIKRSNCTNMNTRSKIAVQLTRIETLPKKKAKGRVRNNISSDDSDDNYVKEDNSERFRTPKKKSTDNNLVEISPVTPPKLKKTHENILVTPKHKTIVKTNEKTPSSLLKNLTLTSPCKVSSNRKTLFTDIDTDDVGAQPKNIYQNARRALHSTSPTDMPGREKEIEELSNFLNEHLTNKTSGSLYVSGPPGTGKTASLNLILRDEKIAVAFKHVYVNCTAIKCPTAIYSRIAKELGIQVSGKTEKDYLNGVETYLRKKHKVIILVLDEIDQLEYKNQSILYTVFEWPSKHSQLILVGIANALDLTDRTLPRLQARCELKPKLMHFPPYTKQQIVQIFTSRLKSAGVLDVFSPVALQMLAGKVASVSGDVRRALDIGRRVIELIDDHKKTGTLKSIENLANDLIDTETKSVKLQDVLTVLNDVYGTSQNLSEEGDDTFPLQQKIIICSLLLMLRKAKNKDITVGKLHEVYRKVCAKKNLLAVDQAEFVGLCALIETRGIIKISGKKEPRLNRVNLEWNEEEVAAALKDKQLMSTILQDTTCLGKL